MQEVKARNKGDSKTGTNWTIIIGAVDGWKLEVNRAAEANPPQKNTEWLLQSRYTRKPSLFYATHLNPDIFVDYEYFWREGSELTKVFMGEI